MPPAKGKKYAPRTITPERIAADKARLLLTPPGRCPEFDRLNEFRRECQDARNRARIAAAAMTEADEIRRLGQPARAFYGAARHDPARVARMAARQAAAVAVLQRVDALLANQRVPITIGRGRNR